MVQICISEKTSIKGAEQGGLMEKVIHVGTQDVKMRASALIPRLYRFKFKRDIIRDITQLKKAYEKALNLPETATEEEKEEAQLSVLELTMFENVAYIMAKHANPELPDEPDEWLDQIDGVFSIYEVLPQILELWNLSQAQTSVPKKK